MRTGYPVEQAGAAGAPAAAPDEIDRLLRRLFPLNRSLTGDGNRETFRILADHNVPLAVEEIPSGTRVFDWTVPPEWRIRDAYILNGQGRKIVDLARSNTHVVSYSIPVDAEMTEAELLPHLHTLPGMPDAWPYRTSYYRRSWGFCISEQMRYAPDFFGPFRVRIDSELDRSGSMSIAQAFHRGAVDDEILISTYCCHPSLANDNLSGLITAGLLFRYIAGRPTHYSYRLVIVPETVGAIAFLACHAGVEHIKAGCVVTTTGGTGPLGMKRSFLGDHAIDRLAARVLTRLEPDGWRDHPFSPTGSDERQYASPGFRIPTMTICKDKYYEYPEYHTSADNLDFVTAAAIVRSLEAYQHWFRMLEANRIYSRTEPHGEYQLGRRGLFPGLGGSISQSAAPENSAGVRARHFNLKQGITGAHLEAFSWLMFACDGSRSVLDIAEMSGIDFDVLAEASHIFLAEGLLKVAQ